MRVATKHAVCGGCDEEREIAARGLCWTCYARVSRGVRRSFEVYCQACGAIVESQTCWVCESRPRVRGKTMCLQCLAAALALSRYWRKLGTPVSFEGKVMHPTRRREFAGAHVA